MMEKVLKMVKPPTNREMKANTSSAVEKKERAWLMEVVASLATVCPVTTSTPGGRDWAMARWSWALSARGWLRTSTAPRWPGSPRICWAVGRSKAARVAPARLLAVPKVTMAEMVKVWGGPMRRIFTRSPTWKWYLVAVPASMATWSGAVGECPLETRRAESWGLGSKDSPRVGAPPVVTALPSGATNWA